MLQFLPSLRRYQKQKASDKGSEGQRNLKYCAGYHFGFEFRLCLLLLYICIEFLIKVLLYIKMTTAHIRLLYIRVA